MRTSEVQLPLLKKKDKDRSALPKCYHCGTTCLNSEVSLAEKCFCCEGCKAVYEIINKHQLCNYYSLQDHPGLQEPNTLSQDKYAFLDNAQIIDKLLQFRDTERSVVTFYIPGVHCSSCMWLLEHLQRFHNGILESRSDFGKKEVSVHFAQRQITLRQVAELLAGIGYAPFISFEDAGATRKDRKDRTRTYKLGVAGFCFANIMMMSFPEYLGGAGFERNYALWLRTLNLLLALPVFFYCAAEFFINAWKGLKAGILNIDAPIALAIIITFSRSLFEIIGGTGAGYLDIMSGIVFFMLVGRMVQERTSKSINFHRDYQSYFPIAVSVETATGITSTQLSDLRVGDIVVLHNDELIPADCVVVDGTARIDYSFVSGEGQPQHIEIGGRAYAGGRQLGGQLRIALQRPVAGSYLTSLWSHDAFKKNKEEDNNANGFVQSLSRHFTLILFSLTLITAIYWAFYDTGTMLNAVTAMLIVACPCALLLSSTFTNGNIIRIFTNAGLFLRDGSVIEQLSRINTIVFDKTGTLTKGHNVTLYGEPMGHYELALLHAATAPSAHPYSKLLAAYSAKALGLQPQEWKEQAGQGILARVDGIDIKVGSATLTGARDGKGNVHARIGAQVYSFSVTASFRSGVRILFRKLRPRFRLSLLSGDHDHQRRVMTSLFGPVSQLLFEQKPMDKLSFIAQLQRKGRKVLMLGDGLNDAGALQQSNVGITLTDDVNNFTPACDAILDAQYFHLLPAFLKMARIARYTILLSFLISICYNLVGLYFAVQGKLHPMIAAILMPASTLSIVMVSTGLTTLSAYFLRLQMRKS